MTTTNQWMQDDALKGIPLPKLEFLQQMLFESKKYSGKVSQQGEWITGWRF